MFLQSRKKYCEVNSGFSFSPAPQKKGILFEFLSLITELLAGFDITSCWNLVSEILMTKFVNSHRGRMNNADRGQAHF